MIELDTYSQTVLEAAKEVFETMIFMEIEPSQEEKSLTNAGIIGTITYKGSLEGCLAFRTTNSCAEAIAQNMLAGDEDSLSQEDVCDAVGEIVNMVMGSIKTRLHNESSVEVSIPSVITGSELRNVLGENTQQAVVRICLDVEHEAEIIFQYRKGQA